MFLPHIREVIMRAKAMCLLAGLLTLVAAAGSCKSSSEPEALPAPSIPYILFKGPGTQDTCSLTVDTVLTMVNERTTQLWPFQQIQPQITGNDYVWTFPVNITATLKAIRQSDGSFTWDLRLNGVQGPVTYANTLILQGTTTAADSKNGAMTVYSDTSTVIIGMFTWSTSDAGVVTGTFIKNDDNGAQFRKVDLMTIPATATGEITTFLRTGTNWVQVFHATWPSHGSPATCN